MSCRKLMGLASLATHLYMFLLGFVSDEAGESFLWAHILVQNRYRPPGAVGGFARLLLLPMSSADW